MRFLPRSPPGTAFLAAAAWLGAVAFLGAVLPVRPRATFTLSPAARRVEVVPGAERLVVSQARERPSGAAIPTGPLRVIELTTGRVERELLDESDRVDSFPISPDGRHIVVVQLLPSADLPGRGTGRVRTFDLATGREFHEIRVPRISGPSYVFQVRLLGDGHTLAYSNHEGGGPVVKWWDYVEGREVAAFPGFGPPIAASADGRWLAAVAQDVVALASVYGAAVGPPAPAAPPPSQPRVAVWDVAARRQQSAWDVSLPVRSFQFSQDGAILVTGLYRTAPDARRVTVHDPATGRELADLPNAIFSQPTSDGSAVLFEQLVDERHGEGGLSRWDVAAAAYRYQFVTGAESSERYGVVHFPDAATVAQIVVSRRPRVPFGTSLTRWTGVAWFGKTVDAEALIFFDGRTGQPVGQLRLPARSFPFAVGLRTLATLNADRTALQLWDVPPRKPLGLFLALAALLAVPIAALTRWRVRRLRRTAPEATPCV
jgi:hypothetical protein